MRPRRRVVYHWQVMADSKPAVLQGAAATSFVAAVERVKPHTKLIGLLAFGHLVIDLNQGSIPAVLPFLRNAHSLSYAEAATIVLVGTLTSSLIQPVFGYLSDQIARHAAAARDRGRPPPAHSAAHRPRGGAPRRDDRVRARRQHARGDGAPDLSRRDSLVGAARIHDLRPLLLRGLSEIRPAARRAAALPLPPRGGSPPGGPR